MYHELIYFPYVNYDQYYNRQFPVPQIPGIPDFSSVPSFPDQEGSQMPTSPPPSFIPQQSMASPFSVDPGAISFCLFRNTYIWLSNGEQFWYYPIFVGPRSVAGFRWNGRFWMMFGMDTRRIISFTCF